MMHSELLVFNDRGIYCPRADVYIDPWKRVRKALVTHGHSDHARYGHASYLCTDLAKPVIQFRLGKRMKIESVSYCEPVIINGVRFSFHPAGHIIGSAQIRVEYKGEVWVASGDYKIQDDGISTAFEPVRCDTFITESTFGLPVYHWKSQSEVFEEIHEWWRGNQSLGILSIICCYSLGKSQRLVHNLDQSIGPVYDYGSIKKTNDVIRAQGVGLKSTYVLPEQFPAGEKQKGLVVATSAILNSEWLKKQGPFAVASASGWMMSRSRNRNRAVKGFVLSDHADWVGLNQAVQHCGAERVYVTHGFSEPFSRWLKEKGLDARVLETEYGDLGEAELSVDSSTGKAEHR